LLFVTALALLAATTDFIGWLWWKQLSKTLSQRPEVGAALLGTHPLLDLPPSVEYSRRLVARDLGMASRGAVEIALERLGELQLKWFPADPKGHLNLARVAMLRGQAIAAVNLLDESLCRDPSSPYLHRLQAVILLEVGRLDDALTSLSFAKALAPGLNTPTVELTPLDQRRVRLDGLRLRRGFYPRNRAETAISLARELRSDGQTAEAESILIELRGHPEIELEVARWAADEGRYEEALEVLAEVASRTAYPERLRSSAWSLIATTRDRSGDREGALAAAETALLLDPESPAPYVTLANLAHARGDEEGAFEYMRRARGMAPADVGLLLRYAALAEMAGRPTDAILALTRAVEIEPSSADIAARLVELQLRAGRHAEAAMTLSRALDLTPTDPRLLSLAEHLHHDLTAMR
jgi:Flp pilus assembly protein TadD